MEKYLNLLSIKVSNNMSVWRERYIKNLILLSPNVEIMDHFFLWVYFYNIYNKYVIIIINSCVYKFYQTILWNDHFYKNDIFEV